MDSISVNSFLNTEFDWYWPSKIYIDTEQGWVFHPNLPVNDANYPMENPFDESMSTEFAYLRPSGVHPEQRDFLWEDGWELLWMNTGKFPNGDEAYLTLSGSLLIS